ncbi:hypothetical protein BT93_A0705 [Corymbia citriodora subsp. variegata]|nr:hypothetical protein BT93_A0705 [Corymbia citriodora subsp. variegata]
MTIYKTLILNISILDPQFVNPTFRFVHQSCWGPSILQHIVLRPLLYLGPNRYDITKVVGAGTLANAHNNRKILTKCNDGMP